MTTFIDDNSGILWALALMAPGAITFWAITFFRKRSLMPRRWY